MRERGVTLVEALVSMLIVAFSLVAMARLQLGMAHGADTARSRSEATQHARAVVEELRSRAFADLNGGADTPGSPAHTAYLRRWTVAGSAADVLRPVEVVVEWADRRGDLQEVVLRTAIARADPADAGGALLASAGAGPWVKPQGRHHTVPRDAVAIPDGDGRPALAWPGPAGAVLVFDAGTGMVVESCATPAQQGNRPSGCSSITAYLLEGYVAGRHLAGLKIVFDQGDWAAGDEPECVWNDVTDPRTGHPLPDLRRYRCLVPAGDHDADMATPPTWTGRTRLAGVEPPGATVCRRGAGPGEAGGEQHPETYTAIGASLDHQNFVIIDSGDCPPGSVLHPSA